MLLVISDGDPEGIGPEEVGVGGVGPVSVRRIDGCGSVCRNRGDRKVGTVGQTVRVGGVEVTGGGSASSAMDDWVSPDTVVASSTGLMVKWMVVVEDAPWSSVVETSKESDPKKLGLGE